MPETNAPETMDAITITAPGGPDVLVATTRPVPRPGVGEVLIRVVAAGVNRPDILQRRGLYPAPPGVTDIPGLEVAGYIAALGSGASRYAVEDQVTALVSGGGYAGFALAPEGQVLPIPGDLGMIAAAGLPEAVFTVWSNVFERGRLQPGEWLLVHGGTSGIGTTAIQLARARGARVLATAGSPEKAKVCQDLGAEVSIDYRAEDFAAIAMKATGGRGVDVILDMVGGEYIARNLSCLAMDGRHVSIAFQRGAVVELDLGPVMRRRLTMTGSTLRPRPAAEKAALAGCVYQEVWPLIASRQFRPLIHATFPLAQARQAHELMESGTHIGKIILTTDTVGR